MLIAYLRSSSYGQYDKCAFSYYLQYVLGWRTPSWKSGDIGSMLHKVMEFLAKKRLAIVAGEKTFHDDESNREYSIDEKVESYIEYVWDFYTKIKSTHHNWTGADKKAVYSHVYDALSYKNGMCNPLNLDILSIEQYFDIEIDEPWAKYKFEDKDGKTIEGNLAIKGSMDLCYKHSDTVLGYQDYKSGARKVLGTEKIKDYDYHVKDFQLRLYHLALAKLYPEYKMYLMTFLWTKDKMAFHVALDKDFTYIMGKIKDRFEKIKKDKNPRRTIDWTCSKMCHFGRTLNKDSKFYKGVDNGKTICDTTYQELQDLGIDRLSKKYKASDNFDNYGEGGGSSNRDTKDEK